VAPHPLFLSEDPDKPAPEGIEVITIRRANGAKKETYPHSFVAADLQSFEDIHKSFGGGDYELIGRNAHHIVSRKYVTLPGPSLPFSPTDASAPAPQPPASNARGGGGDGLGGMGAVIVAMIQSQAAQAQAQAQMMGQMMVAAMSRKEAPPTPPQDTALIQLLMKASHDDRQALTSLFATIATREPPAPSGDISAFQQGMALAMQLVESQGAAASGGGDWTPDTILQTVQAAVEGMKVAKDLAPSRPTVVEAPQPPQPAPPPSKGPP
jgi:hypothetical protein